METVIAAVILATPPTLVALAGWHNTKATKNIVQGNGRGDIAVMAKRTLELAEDLQRDVRMHGDWIIRHTSDHKERNN